MPKTSGKIKVRRSPKYTNFFDEVDINDSVLGCIFFKPDEIRIANYIINHIGEPDYKWREHILTFTSAETIPKDEREWKEAIKTKNFVMWKNRYYKVFKKLRGLGIVMKKQLPCGRMGYVGSFQFSKRLKEIGDMFDAKIMSRNDTIKNE